MADNNAGNAAAQNNAAQNNGAQDNAGAGNGGAANGANGGGAAAPAAAGQAAPDQAAPAAADPAANPPAGNDDQKDVEMADVKDDEDSEQVPRVTRRQSKRKWFTEGEEKWSKWILNEFKENKHFWDRFDEVGEVDGWSKTMAQGSPPWEIRFAIVEAVRKSEDKRRDEEYAKKPFEEKTDEEKKWDKARFKRKKAHVEYDTYLEVRRRTQNPELLRKLIDRTLMDWCEEDYERAFTVWHKWIRIQEPCSSASAARRILQEKNLQKKEPPEDLLARVRKRQKIGEHDGSGCQICPKDMECTEGFHRKHDKRYKLMKKYGLFCELCQEKLTHKSRRNHEHTKRHKRALRYANRLKYWKTQYPGMTHALESKEKDAPPQDAKNCTGCSDIFAAVEKEHTKCVLVFITKCETSTKRLKLVNSVSMPVKSALLHKKCLHIRFSETPIFAACRRGNLDVTKVLVDAGANINQRNKSGFTPLHRAASSGNVELCKYLVDHGADPEAESKKFTQPKHTAQGPVYKFFMRILNPWLQSV